MKGFKLAAAAGAVAIGLGAVGAATANQVTFNLTGTVGGVCGVFGPGANNVDVDFGDLAAALDTDWITVGPIDVSYICNIPGGFDRAISSTGARAGFLTNQTTNMTDDPNSVEYQMTHSGEEVAGLYFDWSYLTAPIDNLDYPTNQFDELVRETIEFRARGVVNPGDGSVTKVAGDYADTVVLSVTAN